MRQTPPVTTTDILKFAGLAFVFVDHFGLFFVEEDAWWRVFGRVAAPIFFFLVGFSRPQAPPWTWFALGGVLTALDAWLSEGLEGVTLNILLNFALLRLVLASVEAQIRGGVLSAVLIALACVAAIPLAGQVLEYGATGWLWALFGLCARLAAANADPQAVLRRNIVAAVCVAAYVITETVDFEFDVAQTMALAAAIVALACALLLFRRADLAWRPAAPVARTLHWIGGKSLEIYAVSLFLMQLGGHVLDNLGGDMEQIS